LLRRDSTLPPCHARALDGRLTPGRCNRALPSLGVGQVFTSLHVVLRACRRWRLRVRRPPAAAPPHWRIGPDVPSGRTSWTPSPQSS